MQGLMAGLLVLLGRRLCSSPVVFSSWEFTELVCTQCSIENLLALFHLFGCIWWVFECLLGKETHTYTCFAESGSAGKLGWLLSHKLGSILKAGHYVSSIALTCGGGGSAIVILVTSWGFLCFLCYDFILLFSILRICGLVMRNFKKTHWNSLYFTFSSPSFQDWGALLHALLPPADPFCLSSALLAGKSSFSHPPPLLSPCSETTVVGWRTRCAEARGHFLWSQLFLRLIRLWAPLDRVCEVPA